MKKKLFLLMIVALMGVNFSAFAQIPDAEGPEAPPPAPISQYIPFLLIAGSLVAFKKLKKIQYE